jgi:hypothetical protein
MERDEVARIAREKLGVVGRTATGEYGVLARLLEPGEEIRAMVITKPADSWLLASGVVVTATDRRLLIVGKALLTRRERVEELPLDTPVRVEPRMRLVLGERSFSLASPPRQVAGLAGLGDRYTDAEETARRKLGKVLAFGIENELLLLAAALEDDEPLLDLAYASTKPVRVLAVCPTRVIVVPQQGMRAAGPATALPIAGLTTVEFADQRLTLGEERFEGLLPEDAAEIIAGRVSARLPSRG